MCDEFIKFGVFLIKNRRSLYLCRKLRLDNSFFAKNCTGKTNSVSLTEKCSRDMKSVVRKVFSWPTPFASLKDERIPLISKIREIKKKFA